MRRAPLAALSALLALAVGEVRVAGAQQSRDLAAAQALFDDGLRLFDTGDYRAACPKLEDSVKLAPSAIGARGTLAECYQRSGRTASAWAAYREVAVLANRRGDFDRARVAEGRAAALEAELSYVTVVVPSRSVVPGLIIARDGRALTAGEFGVPIAVDPGTAELSASAPGYRSWSKRVAIGKREKRALEVPALEPMPTEAGKLTAVAGDAEQGPGRSNLLFVSSMASFTAGAALAASAALVAAGADSRWRRAYAQGSCVSQDGVNFCDATGLELTADARRQARLATVLTGTAATGLAAGGVLLYFWFRSDRKTEALSIGPAVGADQVGLALSGRL
jgi:hypothetical protein